MNRPNNRIVGVVQLAVGLIWLAVMPVFLCFMVFMEARDNPRPDSAAWRLWRALEILLVEPRWLGWMLSALLLGASLFGAVLVPAGIGTLRGTAQCQKWGALAAGWGVAYCWIGFFLHWEFLMPVVNASQNPAVLAASEDLNRASLVALGAGVGSMLLASLLPLSARRQVGSAGNLPKPT